MLNHSTPQGKLLSEIDKTYLGTTQQSFAKKLWMIWNIVVMILDVNK
jgi:hypothetical protein